VEQAEKGEDESKVALTPVGEEVEAAPELQGCEVKQEEEVGVQADMTVEEVLGEVLEWVAALTGRGVPGL
jgi:hypothetical protein